MLLSNFTGPPEAPEPDTGHPKPLPPEASATTYGNECTIILYKTDEGRNDDQFYFAISHELFHCIQYATWDDASRAGAAISNWWMEGTAEYFAELANPGTTAGDSNIQSYDAQFNRSILTLEYENVVFFSWYAQSHGGPEAIKVFIDGMPGSSSNAGNSSALRSRAWCRSATGSSSRGHAEHRIMLPGDRLLPRMPHTADTITISGDDQFNLPSTRYAVQYADLLFELPHYYETGIQDAPPDSGTQWKLRPDGE